MKKLFALLLSLLLALNMTACGGSGSAFEPGTVTGTRYENTFAGIYCEMGSDWKFMSEEEIRKNNEQTMDLVGKDYKDALKDADNVMDMMATHTNGTDTVSVAFEKLSALNKGMSEEKYAEAAKENMKGALTSMGMQNVTLEIGTMTFAGKTHTAINVSAQYSGVAVYEKCAIVKCGRYIVVVTACTWKSNTCQSVLNKFKAL